MAVKAYLQSGIRRGQKTRRYVAGLTLIEILVVVAVIAVLAAVVLPVLARAKIPAQRVRCLNTQRNYYLALRNYVDHEENGLLPREGYHALGSVFINNWSSIAGGRRMPNGRRESDDAWYNALPPLLDRKPSAFYADPRYRQAFYDNDNFIHCPSARFPSEATRLAFQFALFSMAMNSQLTQYGEGPSVSFSRIEQHRRVSDVVLFLDNRLEGEPKVHPAQDGVMLGQPSAYATRFSARHGGAGNLTFADGHGQSFAGRKVVQTDPSNPLVGGPILPPVDIVWDLYEP
jgi:prepilin-type N-terminal cleavage/methylation domain-containing protein/prepilin-type processing-associated H-X9-DG protein